MDVFCAAQTPLCFLPELQVGLCQKNTFSSGCTLCKLSQAVAVCFSVSIPLCVKPQYVNFPPHLCLASFPVYPQLLTNEPGEGGSAFTTALTPSSHPQCERAALTPSHMPRSIFTTAHGSSHRDRITFNDITKIFFSPGRTEVQMGAEAEP